MATYRTNHSRSKSGDKTARVGIFAIIIAGLLFVFNWFTGGDTAPETPTEEPEEQVETTTFDFLPGGSRGQIVYNPYFVLSYAEAHEQAEWVAYELTAERLNEDWVERADEFLPDNRIKNGSAALSDYHNSGYDRGHLVPAADMAFDAEAMRYSFLMSNISPQAPNFNKGIWRELEELTRSWAKKNKALYVVTGPILSQPKGAIGPNRVSVPRAYYKVLLDVTEPQFKGIAFLIPNEVSFEPLYKFAVSIREVEKATGFDFFPDFDIEAEESTFNLDFWEFSKRKYELRVNKWNQE